MAITFINRTDAGSSGAVSSISAASANHTAGNFLAVFVSGQTTGISYSVSDTAGNTYHQASTTQHEGTNTNYLSIFYAYNITGNASNVVTATMSSGSAAFFIIGVQQFSGFGTTDPYDNFDFSFGVSASPTGNSLAISRPNGIIFAGLEADGQGVSQGSGFTGNTNSGSGCGYFLDEYQIISSSTAATAICTSGNWRLISATFSVGGGGSSITGISSVIGINTITF